jgi:octaprenyl-diphosphate synthase
MTLDDITKPINGHLDEFNKYLDELMSSDVSLLNLILKYITRKRGKQVRPVALFLAARVCGDINKRSYTAAAMIELLHTATLIHDDVVDGSRVRRGIASINAEWNNKIAVLIGDFLLARGLLSAIDGDEFRFLKATSKAVKRMSEGELLQIEKSKKFDVDEDTYYKIISFKTASLLSACCELGALSANASEDQTEAMVVFGENLGMAFQIKDDIFDYIAKSSIIGKPVGNDVKEKKITLPLLYALENAESKESKNVIKLIKQDELSRKSVNEIIDFVGDRGGIEYSEKKAAEFIQKANTALEIFPDSEAKNNLMEFANFVVSRRK